MAVFDVFGFDYFPVAVQSSPPAHRADESTNADSDVCQSNMQNA